MISMVLILSSCQRTKTLEEKIAQLEAEKLDLQQKLVEQGPDDGELVHVVFLKTKIGTSTVDRQMYLDEIRKLNRLEYIHDLHVGVKADMQDERSITNNDAFYSIIFENVNEYLTWKDAPEHAELKAFLAPYLAEEPITYDYFVR